MKDLGCPSALEMGGVSAVVMGIFIGSNALLHKSATVGDGGDVDQDVVARCRGGCRRGAQQ
jgi:hypothetical protein